MKYLYYKTDGTHEILHRDSKLEYEELRNLVGGNIEFAQDKDGSEYCINEEGILNNLPPNPFITPMYQEAYHGNIVHGMTDEDGEFVGFEDVLANDYLRSVKTINPDLCVVGKVFTIIAISEMGLTLARAIKSVGSVNGKPAFKDFAKGSRRTYHLRNIKDKDTLIFEGSELPFVPDTQKGNTMRMNGLINLYGDIKTIREWVLEKNLNPFFTAHDRVVQVDEAGIETLVFMDRFASCQLVAKMQTAQHEREGRNVKVGVGFAVGSK